MNPKYHLYIQIGVFIVLNQFFTLYESAIITLCHFIPSVGYIFEGTRFDKKRRKIFHNVFVVLIAATILFYLTNMNIFILGTLNLILHFIMDLGSKEGMMIFYPLSEYKLKLR